MATIAGATELTAGLMLALGLATPLAAAGITGTLAVAMYTHRASGLWSSNGGFELALLYVTGAIGMGLTGAGRFSLDSALSLPHTENPIVAVLLIAISVLLSGGVILRSRTGRKRTIEASS